VLVGLAAAMVAAVAYGAATVMQALGVHRISAVDVGAPWRARILAGRLYAVGLLLDAAGFLAAVVSLRRMPLFLVQSAIASSVSVTAVLAVLMLEVRLSRTEVSALAVTGFGLVLLAVSAQEGPAHRTTPTLGWLLLGSAGLVGLVLFTGVHQPNPARASVVLASASGLGFGMVAIAARTLRVGQPWWHTATQPTLWALLAHGVLAAVGYGFALQRGRITTVAAVTFAMETVFPAIVGTAALGDAVRSHLIPLAVTGFLATLAGSITLARYAESTGVTIRKA